MDVHTTNSTSVVKPQKAKARTTKLKIGSSLTVKQEFSQDFPCTSTTEVEHELDPEKFKSPSKRRSIAKPKRIPQAQGYYRRRLEFFNKKQTATKEQMSALEEISQRGSEMVPEVLDGKVSTQDLFEIYNQAVNTYLQGALLIRQTNLTERKLAAEVWGDNSIASFKDGRYLIHKDLIEENLRPKAEEPKIRVKTEHSAKKKPTEKRKDPIVDNPTFEINPALYDNELSEFMEFTDNMPVTRSKSKANCEPVDVKPDLSSVLQLTPSSAKKKRRQPTVPASQEAKKPRISKEPTAAQVAKKSKSSNSNESSCSSARSSPLLLPPPSPSSLPPSVAVMKNGRKPAKGPPMPVFKKIKENIIRKDARGFVKDTDTPVLKCYCKSDDAGKGCYDSCVNRALHMECGSRCPVGKHCQNKRFQNLQYASFEPFFTGDKGWGIRALEPIKKGAFIVEYVGEVVGAEEMIRRQKMYTKNNHKHHYMMSLRNGAVIDATSHGNYSRFVNHSCSPNAETQKWVVSKEIRIGFFALKDIESYEEIVFDYAFERFGKDAQQCLCGAENCSGFIGRKPGECDNDNDDGEVSEAASEESEEEESSKETIKKLQKPKTTAEEREFKTSMAKARKKLKKNRAEVRKITGRKKNFTSEDVLEFNRKILFVNEYEQRYLLTEYMLNVSDEDWKAWFVEHNGLDILWTWLSDFTPDVRKVMRLQNGIIKFLEMLPVKYSDQVSRILPEIEYLKDVKIPDNIVIEEAMKYLVDESSKDELPIISDKDLARMVNRDRVNVAILFEETAKISEKLCRIWSELPSRNGLDDISADEIEDYDDIYPNGHIDNSVHDDFDTTENHRINESTETRKQPRTSKRRSSSATSSSSSTSPNAMPRAFRREFFSKSSRRSTSRSSSPLVTYEAKEEKRKHSKTRDRSISPVKTRRRRSSTPPRIYCLRSPSPPPRRRFDFESRDSYRNDRHSYRSSRRYDHEDRYRRRSISPRRRNSRTRSRSISPRRRHSRTRSRSISPRRTRYRSRSPLRRHHHDDRRYRKHHYDDSEDERYESRRHHDRSDRRHRDDRRHRSRERSNYRHRDRSERYDSRRKYSISPERRKERSPSVSSKSPPSVKEEERAAPKCVSPIPPKCAALSPIPPKCASVSPIPSKVIIKSEPTPPEDLPAITTSSKDVMTIQSLFPDAITPIQLPCVKILFPGIPERISRQINAPTNMLSSLPNSIDSVCESVPTPPMPGSLEINEATRELAAQDDVDPIICKSEPTLEEEEVEMDQEDELSAKQKPYAKNSDWYETYTDDGIVYYYNIHTRVTSWEEPPPKEEKKLPSSKPLSNGIKFMSKSSSSVHSVSKSSQNHGHCKHKNGIVKNEGEVKKRRNFKQGVWNKIYEHVKKNPEMMKEMKHDKMTQFGREVTHRTLEAEITNGNKDLVLNEEVYASARLIADSYFYSELYPSFVAESRPIKEEPSS